MGIVIDPPPFHKGSDCPACTPGLWPVGGTPMYMFAYFSGIETCGVSPFPAPNGYTFLLQQKPGNFCQWLYWGDIFRVEYDPIWDWPDQSRLMLYDKHGFVFFVGFNDICPPEIIRFTNAQQNCVLMFAGAAGFCILDWSGVLLNVAVGLGIDFKPKLMRESRDVDAEHYVYKLTSLYQRTNFKFKVEL